MKIGYIDKEALRIVRNKMQQVLDPLGEELDVDFQVKNIQFTTYNATIKVEMSVITSDGSVISKAAETFQRQAGMYGLNPNDLNKTFVSNGTSYRIIGLVPRRHRYPISAERVSDGASFKFSDISVKRGLERASK